MSKKIWSTKNLFAARIYDHFPFFDGNFFKYRPPLHLIPLLKMADLQYKLTMCHGALRACRSAISSLNFSPRIGTLGFTCWLKHIVGVPRFKLQCPNEPWHLFQFQQIAYTHTHRNHTHHCCVRQTARQWNVTSPTAICLSFLHSRSCVPLGLTSLRKSTGSTVYREWVIDTHLFWHSRPL